MKRALAAIALAFAAAPAAARDGPSAAALVAAARAAPLSAIDYGETRCDGAQTVATWLKALVGGQVRGIAWSGGACQLVSDLRPGIDASSWPYCARATITLRTPLARNDAPVVEIYLEKPVRGRPGKAYAFRSVTMTPDKSWDYQRGRREFEALWRERFADTPAPACTDED